MKSWMVGLVVLVLVVAAPLGALVGAKPGGGKGGGGGGSPNSAPTASFNGQCSRTNSLPVVHALGNWTCYFDASGSSDAQSPDSALVFAWDFGDGTTGAGIRVRHEWAAQGTYRVTLTVTDPGGLTGTYGRDIHAYPPWPFEMSVVGTGYVGNWDYCPAAAHGLPAACNAMRNLIYECQDIAYSLGAHGVIAGTHGSFQFLRGCDTPVVLEFPAGCMGPTAGDIWCRNSVTGEELDWDDSGYFSAFRRNAAGQYVESLANGHMDRTIP